MKTWKRVLIGLFRTLILIGMVLGTIISLDELQLRTGLALPILFIALGALFVVSLTIAMMPPEE